MRKLTKRLALVFVEQIKLSKSDSEKAHYLEDQLYRHFVNSISEKLYNENELIEVANIVKSTENIVFNRWCA